MCDFVMSLCLCVIVLWRDKDKELEILVGIMIVARYESRFLSGLPVAGPTQAQKVLPQVKYLLILHTLWNPW